jgi:hypothetical protein
VEIEASGKAEPVFPFPCLIVPQSFQRVMKLGRSDQNTWSPRRTRCQTSQTFATERANHVVMLTLYRLLAVAGVPLYLYYTTDAEDQNVAGQTHSSINTDSVAFTRASEVTVIISRRHRRCHEQLPAPSADHSQSRPAAVGDYRTRVVWGA